ncbi:MAG: lytic transglycosylase domain-containing protein [Halomonadaceae bacterium]|nr:lytic transglycosylase domain-containing protein [Halomonadaceae bacterium]
MTASAFSLDGTPWSLAAEKVDPQLLYAVALAESQKTVDGQVRPWPWALNVQGKGYYFDTREEAEDHLAATIARGVKNVDIGPLQINYNWHGHRIVEPSDLFDLATSVRVGADILSEALGSAPHDRVLAVGRYHNWKDEHRARQYGTKVLKYFDIIVKAGGR